MFLSALRNDSDGLPWDQGEIVTEKDKFGVRMRLRVEYLEGLLQKSDQNFPPRTRVISESRSEDNLLSL